MAFFFSKKNKPASVPTSPVENATDVFRCADVQTFPISDSQQLIYRHSNKRARLAPSDAVHIAESCRDFLTLRDHLRRYCAQRGLGSEEATPLLHGLEMLAGDGFLVSRRQLRELCASMIGDDTPATITSIGFPTRNRVGTLLRGLKSFIENSQRHGRKIEFVVMDDSARETQGTCREALAQLRRETGATISYAGYQDKKRFAEELIAATGCAPEIVEFALFNPYQCPISTGANRNALFLHEAGRPFISVDDDMICRITAAPQAMDDRLVFFSAHGPTDQWFFPSQKEAVESGTFVEKDFVGLHEQMLGKDLGRCVSEFDKGDATDFSRIDAEFITRLSRGAGKVAVTFLGHLGDPGTAQNTAYLWLDGDSFSRMTESEAVYRAALSQRAMLRVVRAPSIGSGSLCMGMCVGFDQRDLLPPFIPVQRGQDTLFGNVAWAHLPNAYFAHAPWAIVHAPQETRTLPSEGSWLERQCSSVNSVMKLCCLSLKSELFSANRRERLQALGRHLENLAAQTRLDFDEFVRATVRADGAEKIAYLEYRLQQTGEKPAFWANDVKDYIGRLREAIAGDDCDLPLDLLEGRDSEAARALMQHLVKSYGQLLRAWPDLVKGAQQLREKGVLVASDVAKST